MKKLVLFLLCCLLLLCSASVGYCSGTLEERDGFETYIGKSKSVVRVIAPYYLEDPSGNSYCVDYYELDNNGYIVLTVDFDENDTAKFVSVVINSPTVQTDFDEDIYKMFSHGISLLGVDAADLQTIDEEDDNRLYGGFEGHVYCACFNYEKYFVVGCTNGTD